MNAANEIRLAGNFFFKAKEFARARKKYVKALCYLNRLKDEAEFGEEETRDIETNGALPIYLNM